MKSDYKIRWTNRALKDLNALLIIYWSIGVKRIWVILPIGLIID